jgi:hypothetical protein
MIRDNGNIGIGGINGGNVTAKLHVSGGDFIVQDSARSLTYDVSANELNAAGATFHINKSNGVDVAIGNDDFYVDMSTSRVGIGTTSPSETLGVKGNIRLENDAQRNIIGPLNQNLGIFANPNGADEGILFSTDHGTTTEMIILNGGNVGIGTTAPSQKLQVADTGTHCFIRVKGGDSSYAGIDFGNDADDDISRIRHNNSNNSLGFSTNNTERMTISSSGNVGIGTTSPSGALDVVGTQLIRPITYAANQDNAAITFAASNNPALDDDLFGIRFATNSAGNGLIKLRTNGDDRLAVLSNGNVGIETNSPQNTLHVNGTLRVGPYFSSSDRDHFLVTPGDIVTTVSTPNEDAHYDNSAGNIHIRTNTGYSTPVERMTISSSGNVGIGTTSPVQDLELNKNNANVNLNIRSSNAGNATLLFGDQSDVSAGSVTYANSSDSMLFKVNNQQEKMRITSAGNVGIGTNTPDVKLHVAEGEGTVPALGSEVAVFQNNDNTSDNLGIGLIAGTSGNAFIHFGDADSNNRGAVTFKNSDNSLAFKTNATERVTILSDGNVGIGTTSPTDKLDVASNHSQLRLTDSDDSKFVQFSYSSNFLAIRNNSTSAQHFSIRGNGNVGIGTNTPDVKLHVSGDTTVSGGLTTLGKTTLSSDAFVTETGSFTLGATHKGATVLLQNSASINITVPSQVSGYVTTFIAETQHTASFVTGSGMSGLNSFGAASDMAGIYAQAQIIFKSAEYAFLGGNIS